jgi:putative sigma-54 modulation protein
MGESNSSVHLNITFRNTESTEPLKEYATEKIAGCVRKFAHQDTEAHLVLSVEKKRHIAEVTFHMDGADFVGKEESSDLYASIDSLVNSLSQQLRKHKERITSHH